MTPHHEPAPTDIAPKWGLLFGLTPAPGAPRQVPHDIFGLNARNGSEAERTATRELRRQHLLQYLRNNGPLNTRQLADAFGVSVQVIGADLKHIADQGLAYGSDSARPIWRATAPGVKPPVKPATRTHLREGQDMVDEMKRQRVRFVPMPVLDEADFHASLAEMGRRLDEIEQRAARVAK